MQILSKRLVLLVLLLVVSGHGRAQDPAHATEFRMKHPGNGLGGKPRIAFLRHRLGTDHTEGISMLDMNGDGLWWYRNSRPKAVASGGTSFRRQTVRRLKSSVSHLRHVVSFSM
jgi:hypothetical protein